MIVTKNVLYMISIYISIINISLESRIENNENDNFEIESFEHTEINDKNILFENARIRQKRLSIDNLEKGKQQEKFNKIMKEVDSNNDALIQARKHMKTKIENGVYNFLTTNSKLVNDKTNLTQLAMASNEIKFEIYNLNKIVFQDFIIHEEQNEVISKLNEFMINFWNQINMTVDSRKVRIPELIEEVENLKESIKPNGNLHNYLLYILKLDVDNSKKYDPIGTLNTLKTLYFGIQTYVAGTFYLQDQFEFLAKHHFFILGSEEEHNKYFDYMLKNFNDKKFILLRLIDEAISLMIDFQADKLIKEIKILQLSKILMHEAFLSILYDEPIKLSIRIRTTEIPTPIGHWKAGLKVYYALQYLRHGNFSKIGPWSNGASVGKYACPKFRIPQEKSTGTIRLLYRKFDKEIVELVGIINSSQRMEFHDVDKEIFNIASQPDDPSFDKNFNKLIEKGAKLNMTFENGRIGLHAAAKTGNKNFFEKYLFNTKNEDLNIKDNDGLTPLHIAVANEREPIVDLLMKRNININAKTYFSNLTALHFVAIEPMVSIIDILLNNKNIEVNVKDNNGFTPLHYGILSCSFDVVEALLYHNDIDINIKTNEGFTPLHLAVLCNDFDIISNLLSHENIDINAKTNNYLTALHYAVMVGDLKLLKKLLENKDLDKTVSDIDDWTPLHYATLKGDEDILMELINNNFDVNAITDENILPLHLAAKNNNPNLAEVLIQNGANINGLTLDGETALHIATKLSNFDTASILMNHGANAELKLNFEIFDKIGIYSLNLQPMKIGYIENCVKTHHIQYQNLSMLLFAAASESMNSTMLEYLISKNIDITTETDDGRTFEMLAAQHGSLDSVQYIMLNFNGNKIQDRKLNNLLHFATQGHNLNVVKYLIEERGFNVNMKNRRGDTPLHIAAQHNDLELIKYLIFKDANVNAKSNIENTPLHYAASCASLETIKYLVDKGSNNYIKNLYSQYPVHKAILTGNFDVIKYFVGEKNYNCKDLDKSDLHCLHYAILRSDLEIVTYLLQKEPNLKRQSLTDSNEDAIRLACEMTNIEIIKKLEPDCNGGSPMNLLQLASKECYLDLIDYCLIRDADLKKGDSKKSTPLHLVSRYCDSKFVEFLLKKGADVNAKDKYGQTPLHYATSLENAQILINHNARIQQKDYKKQSPLHVAIAGGFLDIVEFLKENGASVNDKVSNGDTPLHIAAKNGYDDIIEYLLEQGVDINATNALKNMPIHLAVLNKNFEAICILVEANANINALGEMGTTLHFLQNNSEHIAKYLIEEAGTDRNMENSKGILPSINLKKIAETNWNADDL